MQDLVLYFAIVSAVLNATALLWIGARARSRRKLEAAARAYMAAVAMEREHGWGPSSWRSTLASDHDRTRRALMAECGWPERETVAQKRPTRSVLPEIHVNAAPPPVNPPAPERNTPGMDRSAIQHFDRIRGRYGSTSEGAAHANAARAASTGMSLVTITAAVITFAFFALCAVAWGSPRKAWCPVPWDVEWCVEQAGEEARALCAEVNPTTRKECKAAMRFVNESLMRAPAESMALVPTAAKAAASSPPFGVAFKPALAAAASSPPFGVGFKVAAGTRICHQAIPSGCPDWLDEMTPAPGCCRAINLSATAPALMVAPCGPNSGSNSTPPGIIFDRYGKPAVGGFVSGLWNERFPAVCDYLNTLPLAPGYTGPASHLDGMDCGASNCMAGAGGGGGPILACGNGLCQVNRGETCETCPQDCGPCVPVPPPPPLPVPVPVTICGDGVCHPNEGCDKCMQDCGPCATPPPVVNPPVITIACDEVRILPGVNSTGKMVNAYLVPVSPGVSRVVCEVRQ